MASNGMSTAVISDGFTNGSPLYNILNAQAIVPGEEPSYQICKDLYLYHPLGKKIIDAPINKAMAKRREIVVTEDMPEYVIKRFQEVWDELQIDHYVADNYRLARTYGISVVAVMQPNDKNEKPLTPEELRGSYLKGTLKFNSLDPLNAAGSLVGQLDPNRPDFLKYATCAIQGKPYAASRTHIHLYESPIYLSFTNSAFGYVGRSVFNRALYPMQSFLQSMITDNLVIMKSGVLVAKVKQASSIADKLQMWAESFRLNLLKQAKTGNTISILPDEDIESLDLHNIDYQAPRKNILENIALSLDMPASFMTNESLAQGFGEGSEDAKLIAAYIDLVRLEMQPIYEFFDNIIQVVAWSPEYYATIESDEAHKGISYEEWYVKVRRSFKAIWPPAMEPTKKEQVLLERERYTSLIEVFNTMRLVCKGENLGKLVGWVQSNLNESKDLFTNTLHLDLEEISKDKSLDEQTMVNKPGSPQDPDKIGDRKAYGMKRLSHTADRPTVAKHKQAK